MLHFITALFGALFYVYKTLHSPNFHFLEFLKQHVKLSIHADFTCSLSVMLQHPLFISEDFREIPGSHHYGKQHIKIEGKKENKVQYEITVSCSTTISSIGFFIGKLC